MPQTITNPELIELINKNVTELKAIKEKEREVINSLNKELYPRIDALNLENQKFIDMMNAEYGWGNWQDFNAEDLTFIPREEFEGKWYMISNPALRETAKIDDIEVMEPKATLDDLGVVGEQIKQMNNDIIMNTGTLKE